MVDSELLVADAEQLFTLTSTYLDSTDRLQIMEAFEFARRKHGAQRRMTGELFFTHPLTVATYLAGYRLDAAAISAALLHDIAEDTFISIEQISDQFGSEVARLVDGVTKLKEVTRGVAKDRALTPEEVQQATLQKLLQAMTADVRVVIIKLFDRLHNMRTIHGMAPHRQRAKAEETLSVFAPLAYRLGMWNVKSELESLSLQVLQPHVYESINAELERLVRAQAPLFEIVREQILECLTENNLPVVDVRMSPENIYTVYRDLEKQDTGFRDVDRMLRITVLLEDPIHCYTALGYIHHLWPAVPKRFDDYISVRRENLYQSLHTTLVHTDGQPIKVRLRTVDMERIAQMGVLAKWYYAGTPLWSAGLATRVKEFFNSIYKSISLEPTAPAAGAPARLQGVLVTATEIARLVEHWRTATPDHTPVPPPWEPLIARYALLDETDSLLESAVELAKKHEQLSVSFLQRRLRLGYPRAARLMEHLYEMGLVDDPQSGGKTRRSLVDDENDDPIGKYLSDDE